MKQGLPRTAIGARDGRTTLRRRLEDPPDCAHHLVPTVGLHFQLLAPRRCEPVIPCLPVVFRGSPKRSDPDAILRISLLSGDSRLGIRISIFQSMIYGNVWPTDKAPLISLAKQQKIIEWGGSPAWSPACPGPSDSAFPPARSHSLSKYFLCSSNQPFTSEIRPLAVRFRSGLAR